MEEERQVATSAPEKGAGVLKSNGGLKIACAILAVAVVGLVAYLIISKTNVGQKTNCITNSATSDGEKATSDGEIAASDGEKAASDNIGFVYDTFADTSIGYGQFVVTKDGDLYFIPGEKIAWTSTGEDMKITFSVSEEVGTEGKFEFEPEEIGYYATPMGEGQKVSFEGYKLNVNNVQYVTDVFFGQQKAGIAVAIIGKDGNMSVLSSSYFSEDEALKLELKKNVETNVVGISSASHGTGCYPVVHYRDGGSKKLDENIFKVD